jgi:dienelactone hydrolase
MWLRCVWLVAAALALAACGHASVQFRNATPAAPLPIVAKIYRPQGPGPFPAVVLLHGCEGVSKLNDRWARWLRERGYVALVVDSWTPRGLTQTCSFSIPDVPSTERLDDAIGALRYLHAMPGIDRRRIAIMGWSNGGVFSLASVNGPTLARAAARGVTVPEPGFAAAIGVYPGGCRSLTNERFVRPVLILSGEADDWTPAADCVAMTRAMRSKGADIRLEIFPGAYHYFDVEGLARTVLPDVGNDNRPGGCCGATVAYDEAASRRAHVLVERFLAKVLAAGPPRASSRVPVGNRALPGDPRPRVSSQSQAGRWTPRLPSSNTSSTAWSTSMRRCRAIIPPPRFSARSGWAAASSSTRAG